HIEHNTVLCDMHEGTRISLALPVERQYCTPRRWARAFSLFNPHAAVRILEIDGPGQHADSAHAGNSENGNFYRPTLAFPQNWRKFLPTDLHSPWWYDERAFATLLSSLAKTRRVGFRDFVREFRGLSASAKAKAVCDQFPLVSSLSDFGTKPERVTALLRAMQKAATPPSADVL